MCIDKFTLQNTSHELLVLENLSQMLSFLFYSMLSVQTKQHAISKIVEPARAQNIYSKHDSEPYNKTIKYEYI